MSQVIYNGVTLPYPLHSNFQHGVEYENLGHTDRIYTKFDVTVQALINTNYIDTIDSTIAAGSNPATIMKAIRQRLMTPRKQLQILVGGIDLIPANQTGRGGTVDAKNGPLPQSINITAMTETVFLIQYHIIAHYWENNTAAAPNTNNAGDNVLFNRWTESVDIDECNYSTIERVGTFGIRSDNTKGWVADQFREICASISIPKGFKRESANYKVSADGLQIEYRVKDKEVFRQPPFPAFKARGKYTESTTQYGAIRNGHIRLELWGQKSSTQAMLVNAAITIAVNKMNVRSAITNRFAAILRKATIEIEIYENKVTVEMETLMPAATPTGRPGRNVNNPADIQSTINRWSIDRIVNVQGADGIVPPKVGLRGTAVDWLLKAAAYYDPNILAHVLNEHRQVTPGVEPGKVG